MGRSRWAFAVVLATSGLVAACSVIVLAAYATIRFSFEPTGTDGYWEWALSGLAPWAALALVAALASIVLCVVIRPITLSALACIAAVVIVIAGVASNTDRMFPSAPQRQKLTAFADSSGIHHYRTSVDTTNGFPVGVIEWSSPEDPQQLCAHLGHALTTWADRGSVRHPIGGGPEASSPGIPCRWMATSGGWPVSGQVSETSFSTNLRVEVAPPGTQ